MPDYDQSVISQPTSGYRGMEAVMVIIGFSLLVVGLAILILGDGSAQDRVADLRTRLLASIVLAAIGAACATIGLVRTVLRQPVRPPMTLSAAMAFGGSSHSISLREFRSAGSADICQRIPDRSRATSSG